MMGDVFKAIIFSGKDSHVKNFRIKSNMYEGGKGELF